MTKVRIHEDDEGMRNLYPASAFKEAKDDMAASQENAQKNLSPDGMSWTELHIIKEPENSFRALNVSLEQIANAIQHELPRVEEFEVGYDPGNPLYHFAKDPYCYGFGNRLYVRLEVEGDALQAIWYDCASDDVEELAALRRTFERINKIHPIMIADYWLQLDGLIGDQKFLDKYFETLLKTGIGVSGSED
ncbi:hypothetical protein [Pseudaestuariivita rosea]|uniref:hypothetical protein n=1 Tax=Pseudaestuariivita rosea TaxID=2763263 RepID=UPI001ABA25D8|nr:hypothetical protein [Pseudaestuariivita rosea]